MMTAFQLALTAALGAGLAFGLRSALRDRLSPTRRALRRAERGDTERALVCLKRRCERRPGSAAARGALGQAHLLARQPREAEAELRKALELGSRDPVHLAALGWVLVDQGRLDEAVEFAIRANESRHEDFGIHCLYCGLMAHQGRGEEVVPLFDFLRRRALQVLAQTPKEYERGLGRQFDFARREMTRAGLA
jgi:tetratricopeptide (TPR) repeat protein